MAICDVKYEMINILITWYDIYYIYIYLKYIIHNTIRMNKDEIFFKLKKTIMKRISFFNIYYLVCELLFLI